MKIIRWIFFILLGIAALILVVALFLPKSVEIISETEINLPVNRVYYSLATFTDRNSWDPWMRKDTTARSEVSSAEGYVGTKYSWTSENSGSGSMVIDSVVQDRNIYLTLAFEGMNQTAFVWHDLKDEGGKTKLSWGFSQGASYPAGRIFMAVMKGMLQDDFDQGLANLKKQLEERGVKMSSLSEIRIETIPGYYAMVIEGSGTMAELSKRMSELFGSLMTSINEQRLEVSGVPFNHYLSFDQNTGISLFEVGIPVSKPGKSGAVVKAKLIPGIQALEAIHTGPYSEFGSSYEQFMKHIQENSVPVAMDAWEFYLTDPMTVTDESKWKTLIAFPLKK